MPKIKIHYSLIFLLILSLFTDNFFQILLIILSILVHESCHYLVINHYLNSNYKIEISIIGGMLEVNKNNLNLKQKLLVDFSGIIGNILIIILVKISRLQTLNFLMTYNLSMIVFNLIPILPLDGFQIVNDLLLSIYEEEFTFVIIKIVDYICLIVLGIIILYLKIYGLFLIWIFLVYKIFTYNIDFSKIKKYYLFSKK